MTKRVPIVEDLHISPEEMEMFVDLRPYFNHSAVYATTSFSVDEAYKLVMMLGLRHLPILDNNHKVVGILTRKDLI